MYKTDWKDRAPSSLMARQAGKLNGSFGSLAIGANHHLLWVDSGQQE